MARALQRCEHVNSEDDLVEAEAVEVSQVTDGMDGEEANVWTLLRPT